MHLKTNGRYILLVFRTRPHFPALYPFITWFAAESAAKAHISFSPLYRAIPEKYVESAGLDGLRTRFFLFSPASLRFRALDPRMHYTSAIL